MTAQQVAVMDAYIGAGASWPEYVAAELALPDEMMNAEIVWEPFRPDDRLSWIEPGYDESLYPWYH